MNFELCFYLNTEREPILLSFGNSFILLRGKMGASLHRASKNKAIGGKPPYLMVTPLFLYFYLEYLYFCYFLISMCLMLSTMLIFGCCYCSHSLVCLDMEVLSHRCIWEGNSWALLFV